MEIAFRTKYLRSLCDEPNIAERKLGPTAASSLRTRIAELRAVAAASDLFTGNPIFVAGSTPTVTLQLDDGYRLVGAPNHPNLPVDDDGHVRWNEVRRLRIDAITRGHGND